MKAIIQESAFKIPETSFDCIRSFLDFKGLLATRVVSKRWHNISNIETSITVNTFGEPDDINLLPSHMLQNLINANFGKIRKLEIWFSMQYHQEEDVSFLLRLASPTIKSMVLDTCPPLELDLNFPCLEIVYFPDGFSGFTSGFNKIIPRAPKLRDISSNGVFMYWALETDHDLSNITSFSFDPDDAFDMADLNRLFRKMPNLRFLNYYGGELDDGEDELDFQCLPSLKSFKGFCIPDWTNEDCCILDSIIISGSFGTDIIHLPTLKHFSCVAIGNPLSDQDVKKGLSLLEEGNLDTMEFQINCCHFDSYDRLGVVRLTVQRERLEIWFSAMRGIQKPCADDGSFQEVRKRVIEIREKFSSIQICLVGHFPKFFECTYGMQFFKMMEYFEEEELEAISNRFVDWGSRIKVIDQLDI